MASTISFTFLTERQTGTIGDDWKYSLEVEVYGAGDGSHALISKGTLEVPEHNLKSDTSQAAPESVKPLVLPAGEPGRDIRVELRFKAVEVDVAVNDTGETVASFTTRTPAAGAAALVEDRETAIGVEEEPSGLGTAVLRLGYQVAIKSD